MCLHPTPTETRDASIKPHDTSGSRHGPPRVRQQPRVSPRHAGGDGPLAQEAGPPTDPAGSAAESQPAVSKPPHHPPPVIPQLQRSKVKPNRENL